MKKYVKYDNVEYFMPFMFCNDIFIPFLSELLKDENNPIKYVYGCVSCLWTSGRLCNFYFKSTDFIDGYLNRLKKYNFTPLFIFTTLNISDNVLNDEFSNRILDIAINYNAEFVVASDELYNHIKSRYPNAVMHCSVIKAINNFINDKNFDETRFYNEMLDKFKTVVIRPEYTIDNIDKLDKLIPEISRIEIIPNQYCMYNCPNHIEHYRLHELQLYSAEKMINNSEDVDDIKTELIQKTNEFYCPISNKIENKNFKGIYFSDEQVARLIQSGIKNVKLQGRDHSFNSLFIELYNHFFNKDISLEEITGIKNNIISKIIEENKKAQLIFV